MSEEMKCNAPTIKEAVAVEIGNYLAPKSKETYQNAYDSYKEWKKNKRITSTSETVLLEYFTDLSKRYKPTTLWTVYSMLKATINNNENVNIDPYLKLRAFLKQSSDGFSAKKANTFTSEHINKFLNEAPDMVFLPTKVALIMGVVGACSSIQLYEMKLEHIQDLNSAMIINVHNPKRKHPRKFTVTDHFYPICKKYISNRPPETNTYVFQQYRNCKFSKQRIGINSFCKMGKDIANFLKLENAEGYSGHSLRRSSATLLEDAGGDVIITTLKRHGGVKSASATVGDVDNSMKNKEITTNTMTNVNFTNGAADVPSTSNIFNRSSQMFQTPDPSARNEYNFKQQSTSSAYGGADIYDQEPLDNNDFEFSKVDISDTNISNADSEKVNFPSKNFSLFSEYISKHMQKLPERVALQLQLDIETLILNARLKYVSENNVDVPNIVKQKPLNDLSPNAQPATHNSIQPSLRKRQQSDSDGSYMPGASNATKQSKIDFVEMKQKSTNEYTHGQTDQVAPTQIDQTTTSSDSITNRTDYATAAHIKQHNFKSHDRNNERTELDVFAEHLSEQMKMLPEEISLQLQSEFSEIIMQYSNKYWGSRDWIKTESIDDISDQIDGQF